VEAGKWHYTRLMGSRGYSVQSEKRNGRGDLKSREKWGSRLEGIELGPIQSQCFRTCGINTEVEELKE
jgi:hypothetical protein